MRKPLPLAGVAMLCLSLIFSSKSYSQLLNWGLSYSPAWADGNTNGTATSISGLSVNCTSSISISGGSFANALGGSGAQTPTVLGATFTIPGSAECMQITPNFASNTNYSDIVMTFSAFITNVSFRIVDIDKSSSASTTYFDRVTITGSDGTTTYNATLTKYDAVTDPDFLLISGNIVNVNTTSGQAGN
ncbi:MAG TPA: hypothetical protein VI461_02190, partial [Chitinophagaceae bacterium]|nr:hypothetical protein [Chitinophagaceae bacterium]